MCQEGSFAWSVGGGEHAVHNSTQIIIKVAAYWIGDSSNDVNKILLGYKEGAFMLQSISLALEWFWQQIQGDME